MRRILGLTSVIVALCGCNGTPPLEDFGPVGDFRLTERSGRTVAVADLQGKIWIASFVFTRCPGPCPQVTGTMARLQSELGDRADKDGVLLVSFTVDPDRDQLDDLRKYAHQYGADEDRWLFLTGPKEVVYKGRIPARSVVIPGTRPKTYPAGTYHIPCALIVGRRSPSTDKKVSLNQALRDFEVQV